MIDVGTEVKIRAERRMGEELAKAELQAGRPVNSDAQSPFTTPTLADIKETRRFIDGKFRSGKPLLIGL